MNLPPHDYPALRTAIAIPDPHDVDLVPALAIVAAARASIAAVHRVLESAHPILLALRPTDEVRELSDREHYAQLALDACAHLDATLDDYAATVFEDLCDEDDRRLDDIF